MVDHFVLESAMAAAGLDALLATDSHNVIYLTGCLETTGWMRDMQDMAHMLAVVSFPERSFLIGGQPKAGFPGDGYFCQMVPAERVKMVAEQLAVRGLQKCRLGVDLDYAPVSLVGQLQALLPEVEFVSADDLLRKLRAVKTTCELEHMRYAIKTGETAFLHVKDSIRCGVSIRDAASAWAQAVHAQGAFPVEAWPFDFVTQATITVPEGYEQTSAHINRVPARFDTGVMTRLDIGVCYKGYLSDQKIVVCVGDPAPEAVSIYQQHRKRQEFMKATIRPGLSKRQVYDACLRDFPDLDEYVFWIHSIGLDLHEEPRIGNLLPSAVDYSPELTFEAGQVLALEPSWLVEDMYLLTHDGFERLSNLPQQIWVLG